MAENPIDLSKIFNFSDTTPLDQVIAKTQQFSAVLDQMLQTAQKSAQGTIASMQVIQKSVESLGAAVTQADVTTKKGQDTIANGAATTAKAVAQNEEYKKSLADLNTTIKILQEQIDKLSESNKKIPKDNEAQSNSLADLKKQLKDATDAWLKMGDSTDSAIKQKALKNVTDLNTAVVAGQKVITDAKKATDLASGSYNDLALKVANATKQLKAMEGGVGSNSQQFKDLQKFVADGNEKLKAFDQTIGISTRNVGGYTEGIEKAIPALRAISPAAVSAGESMKALSVQFLTLLANPVIAGIALILGGFAGLKKAFDTYTEGTVSGADKAQQFGLAWTTVTEMITVRFKALGKTVTDFLVGSGVTEFLGQMAAFAISGASGVAEFNARLAQNNDILQMQIALQKERIVLITDVSALELEKEKEMFAARDKENRSLQERYDAILRVNEVRKEEIGLKQKEAQAEYDIQVAYFKKIGVIITNETKIQDLFNDTRVIEKKSYDQVTALAEARAKLTAVAKEEFEGTRRIQAIKNQLVDEEINHLLAGIKQEKDARDKYNVEIITADQQVNARILANQGSTTKEKIEAETRNLADAKQLNDKALADELFAFREQALSKTILDKAANDKINKEAGDDLMLRAKLILDAKNKQLDADSTFSAEEEQITQASQLKIQELIKKSSDNILQIIINRSKQVSDAETAGVAGSKDQGLINLNKALENREISLVKYSAIKAKIERESAKDSLEIQNGELEYQLIILTSSEASEKKHGQEIIKIRQQISANKRQITDIDAAYEKAKLQEIHNLEKQFALDSLDTIKVLGDNATTAKIDALNNQLQADQDSHDKQIALAGDDAAAKLQIDKQFSEQQAKIQKEEAKLKHDQAVRDRDIDMAKIIINTAVAISEHLANPIAAALIGALGALELAKVASTPIPAYFTGTSYSKEGLALVAERGPEIGIDRSGDIAIYGKPQLTYLNEGTKILNAQESEPILKKMDTHHMDLLSHQLIDIGIRDIKAGQSITREVIHKLDEVKEATKKNKPAQVNYAKVGAIVYEFKKEEETYVKRTKALSMGSWL